MAHIQSSNDSNPTKPEVDAPPVDETLENKEARELLEHRIKSFNTHRRGRLITIRCNAAYLCGRQNIQIVNNTIQPLPSAYATNVIANVLLPAVQNDISVGTRIPPVFDVVPAGTDEDDKATAIACQKLLPYLLRINDASLHRGRVILWYDLDGMAWRKVWWDPNYSVEGINPQPGQDGHNPELAPGAAISQGEVRVEHVPNTEVIYDFRAKNVDRLDWIIHAKMMTLGEVREKFGKDFTDNIPDSEVHGNSTKSNEFEVEIMTALTHLSDSIAPKQAHPNESELVTDDKRVEYFEYWHRPTKNLPTGAFIVMAGRRIAQNDPYPKDSYPHGELPLIPTTPLDLNGIVVGSIARLSQARPLQRFFNQLNSLIGDNIDAMGNSVIMCSRASHIDFKKVANIAANIIEYDGAYKPSREPGVTIPASIFVFTQQIKRQIDEIFSFHDPSRGVQPKGGPRSAKGLETLQVADFSQMGPMIYGLEISDQKVVYQMLTVGKANYRDRFVSIIGDDYAWTLHRINENELRGKINVIVKRGSSMPRDKQNEAKVAFDVWSAGLLGDPQDPSVRIHTIKQMELGNAENILQSNAKHTNFAKNEFYNAEAMLRAMPQIPQGTSEDEIQALFLQYIYIPPVNSFDDHIVHVFEHTEYFLDNYWQLIGTGAPQAVILIKAMISHTEMHKQVLQQAQEAQLQAQMMAEAFTKGQTIPQIREKGMPTIIASQLKADNDKRKEQTPRTAKKKSKKNTK